PFLFHPLANTQHLHSFPTRRSSDLPIFNLRHALFVDWSGEQQATAKGATMTPAAAGLETLNESKTAPIEAHINQAIDDLLASLPDRKSTRLNSSHRTISYAVFCLKK